YSDDLINRTITSTSSPPDSQGRLRTFVGTKEVCNHYNARICTRNPCHYLHICATCEQNHLRFQCPMTANTTTTIAPPSPASS
ncbi:unnamed protein product, partial [Didymodactylos carnosus]